MPLALGSRLDSYEIVAPLGAGGMGEVYRARDTALKRDVAIKVLPEYWSRDPERLRRFEQEAQATAALNHPNVVSIFHVGQYDGSPYIVTELLQGETLRDRLRKGPMRLREVLDYGVELARGLAAAHGAGIVHRDLKPDNIWVTKDGRVKILDFGLAKLDLARTASADGATVSGQQSTPGHVLGTVGYMSPEQVRGQAADARSDIFAVGVVLYEMLTGKPAFRKATSADTMSAILNEDPSAVSQVAPSVPPGLQRVVTRCLAKNPAQRIQHASDLEFALEALSDSGSISVPATDQSLRSRWIWMVATAAVVALAAALIAWWRTPSAVPVVESITQLTDDGEPKESRIESDGARVYFNEGQARSWIIAQVSVNGGPSVPVNTGLANPQLVALERHGSQMLALVDGLDLLTSPMWSVPLPAGQPRRVGSVLAEAADVFPDGRIVFADTKDLFVCDKDGSNTKKLFSNGHGAWNPAISPDGRRIAFTTMTDDLLTLVEVAADGTDFRVLMQDACCGQWSPDGNYIVYAKHQAGDVWALPVGTGFFHRRAGPVRLTNGSLEYAEPTPSRDGKQIFAVGTKRRGELVRYDTKSHQFVPFLSGMSSTDPTFSRDGQWVAYASYPDHTIWRSRSDGSQRVQLTYPPMEAAYPSISPDGTKIAFSTIKAETYVVSADGGPPQKIVAKNSAGGHWSPDGNLLIVTCWTDGPAEERHNPYLQMYDFRTGSLSMVPGSQGLVGGAYGSDQASLVAANQAGTKLLSFDFKSQKWSDLVARDIAEWTVSPDGKYLYFTTGGPEPMAQRLRFADHQIETITSLKDLRRVLDSMEMGRTQINVAPDGSPIFTRDIGTQEIYALTVRWP